MSRKILNFIFSSVVYSQLIVGRRCYASSKWLHAPASGSLATPCVGSKDQERGSMKDEYGKMDSSGETFNATEFVLESGTVLKGAKVCAIAI